MTQAVCAVAASVVPIGRHTPRRFLSMSIFDRPSSGTRCGIGAGQVSKKVSLTPELDAYISTEVASGRFQNASEVVRAALRLMADYEVRLVPRQTPRLRPERVSPQKKGGARRRE